MRPFLLLGDISGQLALLGLFVVAIGGLLVAAGIALLRARTQNAASRGLGSMLMLGGFFVLVIALAFLADG
jgi:hypothetical protein